MTREEWLRCWGFVDGTPEAEQAWAEKQAFTPQRLNNLIMSDIQPYQAMGVDIATGKAPMITSRSQHNEYLRRNGYVEIGNEKVGNSKPPAVSETDIARDIKKSIEQTGARL